MLYFITYIFVTFFVFGGGMPYIFSYFIGDGMWLQTECSPVFLTS